MASSANYKVVHVVSLLPAGCLGGIHRINAREEDCDDLTSDALNNTFSVNITDDSVVYTVKKPASL